mmetsp:Transcript_4108/g.25897  ORF Transcript_4108/g.25897 Transcript_4108/m.25897 type:complete len:165 (-) Transcript_4108:1623-2117(-)
MLRTFASTSVAQARRVEVHATPTATRTSLRFASEARSLRSTVRSSQHPVPSRFAVRVRATDETRRQADVADVDLPESVWSLKPWWCQPYSILLVGATLVGSATYLVRSWEPAWLRVVSTSVVATAVLVWWSAFLVAYPRAYAEYRNQAMQQKQKDVDAVPPERT